MAKRAAREKKAVTPDPFSESTFEMPDGSLVRERDMVPELRKSPRVKRVLVESTPVASVELDSAAALREWHGITHCELMHSIVRVRARVGQGQPAPTADEVQQKLLATGAVAAHVSVDPVPAPRQERAEGISKLQSPRARMSAYLVSVSAEPGVVAEVERVMGEEGL